VQKNEIIEIGAIKAKSTSPFKIVEEFSVKVKPHHLEKADKEALKIVGYSEEEWKDALELEEALAKLDEFGKNGVLVGYNVSFDWSFLDKAYFSFGRQDPFYYHRLDVMPMAYLVLNSKRSLKRFSLGEISRFFNLKRLTKHRALDDAHATYLVFKALFEYTKGNK
jgi:DNA polymerase-3 subunit epsilon